MDRDEFGRRFRQARLAANLTQDAMATQLGCSRPRIAEYESGARIPTFTRLVEIVEACKLDPRFFWPFIPIKS